MSKGRPPKPDNLLHVTHPHFRSEYADTNELGFDAISAGSGRKVDWVCTSGHVYAMTVANRTGLGQKCPFCSGKRPVVGVNDLATTRPELAALWHPDNRDITTYMRKSKARVLFRCPEGHVEEHSIAAVAKNAKGYRCQECASLAGRRPDLVEFYSSENLLPADRVSAETMTLLKWNCPKGHEWEQIGQHVFKKLPKTNPCPQCMTLAGSGRADLLAEWDYERNDEGPENYGPMSKHQAWWRCTTNPEHTWPAQISNRTQHNSGCPKCRQSSGEKGVGEFLRTLGLTIEIGRRDIICPLEVDIFLPDLNLAIEYNGVYWHSKKKRNDHKTKVEALRELGIDLLVIWEDDWRDRPDVVERMLRHKTGKATEPTLGARKTTVIEATFADASMFLEAHHIQGPMRGTSYLGLEHEGVLVAVAVFAKTGKADQLLLARFATSAPIPGGFSKVMAAASKRWPAASFLTFADLAVSNGDLYERTGWTADGLVRPDYQYVVGYRRVHKFNYRRARFESDPKLKFDPSLSESELAKVNRIPRVYDYGKVRYVLHPPHTS